MNLVKLVSFGILLGECFATEVTWEVLKEGGSFRNDLNEVEWVGTGFVAVGDQSILTSADGLEWEQIELGDLADDTYEEIAVGPGSLVIGRGTAVYSSDHTVWQQSVLPAGVAFLSAAGDGSQFVALGDNGSLYGSTDGLSWTVLGDAPGSAKGLTFGNGTWVSFDETYFYYSTDGQSWTSVEQVSAVNAPGESRYVPEVEEVDFSGGLFIATGVTDDEFFWNTYATSSDGETWTIAEAPPYELYYPSSGATGVTLGVWDGGNQGGPSLWINDVHLDSSGEAVVIHSGNEAVNSYGTYSDTYDFEYRDSASSPSGSVVVVGNKGLIMSSDNSSVEYPSWREVGSENSTLIDSASDGNTVIGIWQPYDRVTERWAGGRVVLKTEDGTVWEPLVLTGGDELSFDSVSYVNGGWFLGDYTEDRLLTSDDAMTWTEQIPIFASDKMPIPEENLYGSGVYLSVSSVSGFQSARGGNHGVSSNGIEWDDLPEEISGVAAFGGGEFKVLDSDRVFTSADGINWTSEAVSPLPGSLVKLNYFKGRWLLEYYSGSGSYYGTATMISSDCVNWVPLGFKIEGWWQELNIGVPEIFEMNGYLVSGKVPYNFGGGSVSSDGVNWEGLELDVPQDDFLEYESMELLPLGDRVLAVGPNQISVISSPFTPAEETKALSLIKPGFLEMAGVAGKEYRLLESDSFEENDWSGVGDWQAATGDGAVLFWTADEGDGRMFYRAEERTAE